MASLARRKEVPRLRSGRRNYPTASFTSLTISGESLASLISEAAWSITTGCAGDPSFPSLAPRGVEDESLAEPTLPLIDHIMKSPKINVILATGGTPMVRAAYSSGNPAIGVGPGNAPALVDASADLEAIQAEKDQSLHPRVVVHKTQ